ncbi:MAG: trypsin-like peptidase domain-containing protein [Bacteroidales bacterium]
MAKASSIILAVILITSQVFGISCSKNRPNDTGFGAGNQNNEVSSPAPQHSASGPMGDFVMASKAAMPAVVHIRTQYNTDSQENNNPLAQLFGLSPEGSMPAMGSGSGVIISPDGYIATNNHVVDQTSSMEVILPDKRIFKAELIGRDPNTDLALLKIKADNLTAIKFGNSDNIQIGEWVLAVGYPFSLNTTVTAGIISAKSRSIGIIEGPGSGTPASDPSSGGSTAIESFIQTDAAINPGNSGGALVNTNGELVGINSAIASQTGSYAGYAFAIPVNLAKKILDDLREFGTVKRGVLGVAFPSPSGEEYYLQQQKIAPGSVNGVYITNVMKGSAAEAAGLKEGDIIQSIDGLQLASSAEFSERIARHRPGDEVKLTYLRNGKANTVTTKLKGETPPETTAKNSESLDDIHSKLGITLSPLTDKQKQYFGIKTGMVISAVEDGSFFDQLGIPKGTIIAYINGKPINNAADFDSALLSAPKGVMQVFAIAPDGSRLIFNVSLGT